MKTVQVDNKYTAYVSALIGTYSVLEYTTLAYINIVGNEEILKRIYNKKVLLDIQLFQKKTIDPEKYIYKFNKRGDTSNLVMIHKPLLQTRKDGGGKILNASIFTNGVFNSSEIYHTVQNANNAFQDEIFNGLFNIVQNHTSIPMLKEWANPLFRELVSKRKISIAKIYKDNNCPDNLGFKSLLFLECSEEDIIKTLTYLLRGKTISIKGCNTVSNNIIEIDSLKDYMDNYGEILKDKVVQKFKPKFNPMTDKYDKEVEDITNIVKYRTPIDFYDAQKNVIQGCVTNMDKSKHTIISAECGAGKTAMASASIVAHAKKHNNSAYTVLVMCPGHITGTNTDGEDSENLGEDGWKKEIETIVPMSEAVVVKDLSEFIALENKIKDKTRKRSLWIVMSKDVIKSSYYKKPAVNIKTVMDKDRTSKTVFYTCPECGGVLYTYEQYKDKGKIKKVKSYLNDFDFDKIRSYNYHCINQINTGKKDENGDSIMRTCNAKLWTASTHDNAGDWVKFSKAWYHKSRLKDIAQGIEHNDYSSLPRNAQSLCLSFTNDYDKYKNETLRTESAPRKFSISEYIRKYFKNEIDYALFDEVHELAGDSIQGKALADICKSVWKTLSLTGTLFNGRADFIFHLLFRFKSNEMIKNGYANNSKTKFSQDFGVIKTTSIFNYLRSGTGKTWEDERLQCGISVEHKKISTKSLPGISPLIFSKYLLDNTVFLKLKDITDSLAPYREYPISVDMDEELRENYIEISKEAVGLAKVNGATVVTGNKALMSAITYMDMFVDQPYGLGSLVNNEGKLAFDAVDLSKDVIRNKEKELIKICKEKKEKGEKFLVFYHWSNKLVIADRLNKILKDAGINTIIMDSSVKNNTRQSWILDKVNDYDGVLLNPSLVESGANLLPYTTIIFYEFGTKSLTMRQASRRSWRLNQTKPVSVYFLYYKDTVQEQALSVMSSKLRASSAIEGDFAESGLLAMSQNDDIITELANNLVRGTKLKVTSEDLEQRGLDEQKYLCISKEREDKKKNRRVRNKTTQALKYNVTKNDSHLDLLFA